MGEERGRECMASHDAIDQRKWSMGMGIADWLVSYFSLIYGESHAGGDSTRKLRVLSIYILN